MIEVNARVVRVSVRFLGKIRRLEAVNIGVFMRKCLSAKQSAVSNEDE
jgi:hypothetical protein